MDIKDVKFDVKATVGESFVVTGLREKRKFDEAVEKDKRELEGYVATVQLRDVFMTEDVTVHDPRLNPESFPSGTRVEFAGLRLTARSGDFGKVPVSLQADQMKAVGKA